MKHFLRDIAVVALIIFVSFFTVKHFTMSSKLDPLCEKFYSVAERYEGTKERAIHGPAVYRGALDSLVAERNRLLRKERYIMIGGWVVRGGRPETATICVYAGFMPERWYRAIAR